MTFKLIELFRHILGPRNHVKRRCLIDGEKMERGPDGIYICPQGHILDPDKKSPVDAVTEASKGHQSGDI